MRKLAISAGFVAHPAADRYHQEVVPLGGGIAIFITLMAFIVCATAAIKILPTYLSSLAQTANIDPADFLGKINQLVIILLCVFVLFVLGLWDDRKHLGPFSKLIAQFAVAVIAAGFADVRVEFFIENKIITTALSAIWIVLIINAFNFLDNMDGACGGIAIIASCILFTAATLSGQVFIGGLALVFIGTLL